MIRLEEPLGEAETVARGVGGEGREEGWGVSGDGVSGSEVAAAVEDLGLARLFIAHDHDAGEILAEVVECFFGGLGFAAGAGEGGGGEIARDVVAEFSGFFLGAIGIADEGGDVVGEGGAGGWLRGGSGGEAEAAEVVLFVSGEEFESDFERGVSGERDWVGALERDGVGFGGFREEGP